MPKIYEQKLKTKARKSGTPQLKLRFSTKAIINAFRTGYILMKEKEKEEKGFLERRFFLPPGIPMGMPPVEAKKVEVEKAKGIEIPVKFKPTGVPMRTEEEKELLRGVNMFYHLIPRTPKKRELVYAYANIKWNEKTGELLYHVKEPAITQADKELIEKVKRDLEERLDIDFTKLGDVRAKELLREEITKSFSLIPDLKIDEKKKNILTYYIERDVIGLGRIEPLTQDPSIEDISCDGVRIALYVYHRDPKFGSMKTNIIFNDKDELNAFVTKLAQKCNKTISIAEPLLDGALPDGSRVQATLGTDIARRGSNFTVRKFTEKPLTPTHMLNYKTLDPTQLAYLWLAIENGQSILVSGGTATGKCIAPTEPVQLANGEIKPIEDVFRERLGDIPNPPVEVRIQADESNKVDVLTFDPETLKITTKPVDCYWRMAAPKQLIRVKTDYCSEILVTPEHPFFTSQNGGIEKIRADLLHRGDYIAVPRRLHVKGRTQRLNLLDYLSDDLIYAYGAEKLVNDILNKLKKKFSSHKGTAKHFGIKPRTMLCWRENNAISLKWLKTLGAEADYSKERLWKDVRKIKGKTSNVVIPAPKTVSKELLKMAAYVMADGTIHHNHVILTNSDLNLLNEFLDSVKKVFSVDGFIEKDKKTYRAVVHSSVIAAVLEKVFEIPKGKKSEKITIPSIVQKCDNKAVAGFLRILYDCESHVSLKEREIEFTTGSGDLAKSLPALLLRYGIISGVREKRLKNKIFYRITIYGKTNFRIFYQKIGFKHEKKLERLEGMLERGKYDTNVDLVPGLGNVFWNILVKTGFKQQELAKKVGISRRALGMYLSEDRKPSRERLKDIAKKLKRMNNDAIKNEVRFLSLLANSDIFWTRIEDAEETEHNFKHVYDFTVSGNHNFIAGAGSPMIISNTCLLNALSLFIRPNMKIVSIEDTPELRLPHMHWIPEVARTPISIEGKVGEVSLFDLLKSSLRQRPDYIVLGEVRGKEAFVLFQQMATGHPSLATIHAASFSQLVDRLITPPISLPPSLLENINIVIFLVLSRMKGSYVRRADTILEIVGVKESRPVTKKIFEWKPVSDSFEIIEKSVILSSIAKRLGMTEDKLKEEMARRKKVLEWMLRQGIFDYREVAKVISTYYSNPERIMDLVESS